MSTPVPQAASTATIALIGNPNTGKTTLFNALTGLSQQVGNYPGVTVERKQGRLLLAGQREADLLDLPGTYSLSARAPDEVITVDVLLGQQIDTPPVDLVLAIADASNLRRNLYLVSQLLDLGLPVVVALNMTDVAAARGIHIETETLARELGVAVVPICAHRRQGLNELRRALEAALADRPAPAPRSRPDFPALLNEQAALLARQSGGGHQRPLSPLEAWYVLVDEDGHAERRLRAERGPELAAQVAQMRAATGLPAPLSAQVTQLRYRWIDQLLARCVRQPAHLHTSRSDRLDRVLTHRVWGTLLFVLITATGFQAIYRGAAPLMDWVDAAFGSLGQVLGAALPPGPLQSLLVDGVIAGVGGVLVFLPQIAILFLFVALLEDFGYMARAAFLMDRLLTFCGLSGKSFIPLISSFACAVPGIMATRTIEDRRDRFTTILVAPLMSCSARLPVYTLFIAAFIPDRAVLGGWFGLQGLTLLAMYSLGVVLAVPVAWLLKKTLLRGEAPAFLLELPSYKWPEPRTVFLRVYHSSRAFVVRAGGIILATTIAMWALAYFPRPPEVLARFEQQRQAAGQTLSGPELEQAIGAIDQTQAATLLRASYLGQAGDLVEPLVRPLGWDWSIGMATLASLPAREVVISVLGTIYSLGGDQDENSSDLRQALTRATRADGSPVFTVPVALSIMVFFALCAQCISTLAIIQRETGTWRWAFVAFAYLTVLAYLGALAIYQFGTWMGW
ncbi:MAG: ferrous iron transport protein B [Candidatus Latescibacteria bacterium]|nr:ferrous iron transport protein B [Candidatus Latescibacterota bacterium]